MTSPARVLAQVVHDGPAGHASIAAALAAEPADVLAALDVLRQRRHVAPVRMIRGGRVAAGWEATKSGRIEAAGGAQMSMVRRPSVAVQPALF